MALGEARAKGFHQILWLFGQEGLITEAGASNFFAVIREKYSKRLQLLTAPLDDKIILDGVTRRSVLELARERLLASGEGIEALEVVERKYSIHELIEAHKEGRLVEAFAAGTAYFIAPVVQIQYKDTNMVPTQLDGIYTNKIKEWLKDIMYGREAHEWGVVVEETEWAVENVSDSEMEDLVKKIKELKGRRGWEAALDKVREEEASA
jgi:branched-chain amino acid aminotransferase